MEQKYQEFLSRFVGDNNTTRFDLTGYGLFNGYVWATDRNIACGVKQSLIGNIETTDKFPHIGKMAAKYQFTDAHLLSVSDLFLTRKNLRKLTPKSVRCPECKGTGEVKCRYEHTHICPDCDGTKMCLIAEHITVKLGDHKYQWHYIKNIIDGAKEFNNGQFEHWRSEETLMQLFRIGGGIQIYVMPLISESNHFIDLGG